MSLSVRVPASTSNLGAGFDCLGLALDIWLEAILIPGSGTNTYSGALADLTPRKDAVHERLTASGLDKRYHLQIHSDIPVSRGLGSSAAARVAALALEQLARDETIDPDRVFDEAHKLEGHPDNAGAAVYGGLVLAAHRPTRLAIHPSVAVALAVPKWRVETQAARSVLPETLSRATAVNQASRAAALIAGLANGDGDLIGYGMDDQIAIPHRGELIPRFDAAVAAGREAGAYGVTTSGSGSTLLALTPRDAASTVATALADVLGRDRSAAAPLTPAISEMGMVVGD